MIWIDLGIGRGRQGQYWFSWGFDGFWFDWVNAWHSFGSKNDGQTCKHQTNHHDRGFPFISKDYFERTFWEKKV